MGRLWLLMVSSFQLGFNPNPIEQTKYSTPGAMEQAGLEDLKAPWATSVIPAIWSNTETMGDIFKGSSNITDLNLEAIDRGETRLSPAELNARYPHMNFETPQYASTAKYMAERQSRIHNLEWLKEHSTIKTPGAMFLPEIGSYIAKSFTDPTELALMAGMAFLTRGASFAIPQLTKFSGAGLSYKMAGMVMPKNLVQAELQAAYLPLSARLSGRAIQGFAEEALANAVVEPCIGCGSAHLGHKGRFHDLFHINLSCLVLPVRIFRFHGTTVHPQAYRSGGSTRSKFHQKAWSSAPPAGPSALSS